MDILRFPQKRWNLKLTHRTYCWNHSMRHGPWKAFILSNISLIIISESRSWYHQIWINIIIFDGLPQHSMLGPLLLLTSKPWFHKQHLSVCGCTTDFQWALLCWKNTHTYTFMALLKRVHIICISSPLAKEIFDEMCFPFDLKFGDKTPLGSRNAAAIYWT